MCYAGMGVYIFPLLVKLIIKGRVHSSCVHVVSSWDDEITSVPEAEVPNGCRNLLLVMVAGTPVPDCNKVNIVMTVELELNMLKIKSNMNMIIQPDCLHTFQHCPCAEKMNTLGKAKWSKVGRLLWPLSWKHWSKGICGWNLYSNSYHFNSAEILGSSYSGQTLISRFVFHICDATAFLRSKASYVLDTCSISHQGWPYNFPHFHSFLLCY